MKHLAKNNFCNLGDVATYINGYAFKPTDWGTEGLQIIRIQDLTGNSYQANYFSGEVDNRFRVHSGDILISWSASLGVFEWHGGDAVLNQHIFKVVFDKIEVDKRFFIHQLKMLLERFASEAHGATMKHLTRPVFNSLPFYAPPLMRQQKIASVLERVSNLITFKKQQLAKLDQLTKSRFIEMFGDPVENPKNWKTLSMREICLQIGDGLNGTPLYSDNGQYPFINGNNLSEGKIIITASTKFVDITEFQRLFVNLSSNSILLSINGTLGKLAFYQGEKVVLGKSACYCDFVPEMNKTFMFCLMNTAAFQHFLEDSSTKSTIKNVGLKAIRDFKVIIPPLDLQNEFAAFVEQLDKSKLADQTYGVAA